MVASAAAAGATIGIVAGEASGDALGAALIAQTRRRLPDVRFVGIAGPKMAAAGCEVWYPSERLAVRGFAEVLRHLPAIARIRRDLHRRSGRPALDVDLRLLWYVHSFR